MFLREEKTLQAQDTYLPGSMTSQGLFSMQTMTNCCPTWTTMAKKSSPNGTVVGSTRHNWFRYIPIIPMILVNGAEGIGTFLASFSVDFLRHWVEHQCSML